MIYAFILVAIIGVGALIGTLAVARTVDANYGTSTKRNIGRLTIIYIILILGLLIGIGWYVVVIL